MASIQLFSASTTSPKYTVCCKLNVVALPQKTNGIRSLDLSSSFSRRAQITLTRVNKQHRGMAASAINAETNVFNDDPMLRKLKIGINGYLYKDYNSEIPGISYTLLNKFNQDIHRKYIQVAAVNILDQWETNYELPPHLAKPETLTFHNPSTNILKTLWRNLGVEYVLECSLKGTTKEGAQLHIAEDLHKNGLVKVIIIMARDNDEIEDLGDGIFRISVGSNCERSDLVVDFIKQIAMRKYLEFNNHD